MALGGAYPFVSSGGIRVLAEAILYRPFKLFSASHNEQAFAALNRILFSPLLLGGIHEVERMGDEEYITSVPSKVRRNALKRAGVARRLRGANHPNYTKVNPFGKTEKLPHFAQADEPTWRGLMYIPRLIQATHDETHLDTGPYFKPAVAHLKEVWGSYNWIFYGSASPDVLDEWINRHSDCKSFYCGDLSAFDATWTDFAFDTLESVYRRLFPGIGQWFWELLRAWRRPRSVRKCMKQHDATAWLKYAADCCLASGRDDTALANALLNGLALAMSFAAALANVDVSEVTQAHMLHAKELCAISVVGDDSLVCCRFDVESYVPAIESSMRAFGLVAKSQATRELSQVTYLGGMPYKAAGRYYWGPTIGRRFYKAFWQTEPKGNLPAWLHGVSRQLLTASHVPILHDAALRTCQLLEGYKSTIVEDPYSQWQSFGQRPAYDETTMDWLVQRYSRHGLTRNMLEADIRTIGLVQRLPACLHLPAVTIMTMADDL